MMSAVEPLSNRREFCSLSLKREVRWRTDVFDLFIYELQQNMT